MGQRATPGTPRVLRAMNDRAALDLLLAHGPLSRTRIGRLTGLSKPTVSQLLARLEAAGLVLATGRSEGRPGPNAQLYEVNPATAHVAGVDVRPGRLLAGIADVTGRTVATSEVPAVPGEPPETLVVRALDEAAGAAGLERGALHRVVLGTPGAFDPHTGRLRYARHLPGWHDPALLDRLAALLPMPLTFDNDVNLVAVAEHRLGSACGHDDFALLWIEQGIGAALVLGGRLHRGWTGGAGELGFLPVPGAPLVRRPGRANAGGFQHLAGPDAVLATAERLGLPAGRARGAAESAARLLAAGSAEVAAGSEGRSGALAREFATGVAVGLCSLVAVVDPALVVLAGGLLTAGGEPLRRLVEAELAELAVPRPRLALAGVAEHPVLNGAVQSALAATRDEVFDTSG